MSEPTHYLSNKKFLIELEISKQQDELTPAALNMIILIATRLSTKFSYRVDSDREDCKWHGVEDAFMYWRNFDASRNSNAFAYFTQVCKNGFAKEWRTLYKDMPRSAFCSINNLYNI